MVTWSKHWKSTVLALGAVIGIVVASRYVNDMERERRAVEAFEVVHKVFAGPPALAVNVGFTELFLSMLEARAGVELLHQLADGCDQVVFDEELRTVLYLHPWEPSPKKSSLGRVTMTEKGGRHFYQSSFPRHLKLRSLKLEQGTLTIGYAFSSEEMRRSRVERAGGTLGELCEAKVVLDSEGRRSIGYSDLGLGARN